jgi:uncharacterized protein
MLLYFAAFLSVSPGVAQEDELTANRIGLPSAEEIAKLPEDGGAEFNRLIFSSSPYLLQHARNPVDWYPWCDEAFARAKAENKPVLLSVGYSTCYWCHVMERECFEKEDVAKVLNERYICVKVDREERPDIDSIYITAAQLMVGGAGWPNNVWLTSDKKPWYAATYVPKDDGEWGEGFVSLAKRLATKYAHEFKAVDAMAGDLSAQIERLSAHQSAVGAGEIDRGATKELLRQLSFAFDSLHGGIGLQPKFPPHGALAFWIYEYNHSHDEKILAKITRTLDAIVKGGLQDHAGGGFHRYCTDQRWVLPHFEKMLYDNAQLARSLCDAWLITGNEEYRSASEAALEWVLTEMRDKDGGFFSAVDAETHGEEGLYYTYTYDEAMNAVGPEDWDWFAKAFNFDKAGNYLEAHTAKKTGRNVLYRKATLKELAAEAGSSEEEISESVLKCLKSLKRYRGTRDYPHVDDKVLTSWNALMVGSLAYCGRQFGDQRYIAEAQRGGRFILEKMRENGRLAQSWRDGKSYGDAYLDSYAYLARAYLELYQSTGDKYWLESAEELARDGLGSFKDQASGGYFFSRSDAEKLISASKTAVDDVTPSGNGAAALALVRLANLTGKPEYAAEATACIGAFTGQMKQSPLGTQSMYLALAMQADGAVSESNAADTSIASGIGGAAQLSLPDASSRQVPVQIDLYISKSQARPAETINCRILIGLDAGFHVNSNTPLQDMLLPTIVLEGEGSAIKLLEVSYPNGTPLELAPGTGPQSVYLDGTAIDFSIKVPSDSRGSCNGSLRVNLQPCDEKACQMPQIHELHFSLDVSEKGGQPAHPEIFGGEGSPLRGSGGGGARSGMTTGIVVASASVAFALLMAFLVRRRRKS